MVTETEVKCEACGGKGFTEYESGVFQVECALCGGTGKVAPLTARALEEIPKPKFNHAEAINNAIQTGKEGIAQLKKEAHELGIDFVEETNDSSSGIERNNQPIGGEDTGQPTQPGKPTPSKKARKRSR